MRPTDILKGEHRVIVQVLRALECMADRCAAGEPLDVRSARQAIDFFRNFADRCHHGKEEDHLFPALEARGLPRDAGPTAVMRAEHEQGRLRIQGMEWAAERAAAGDARAMREWVTHARAYAQLLRQHIRKEDEVLFPIADRVLGEEVQGRLLASFEEAEEEDMGAGAHEEYLELANELADRFGVARAEAAPAGHGPPGCGHHAGP
jgi:hemerythrin-like domain-containing protein